MVPNMLAEISPRIAEKRPPVRVGYSISAFATASEHSGGDLETLSVEIPGDRKRGTFLPSIGRLYFFYQTEMPSAVSIVEQLTMCSRVSW